MKNPMTIYCHRNKKKREPQCFEAGDLMVVVPERKTMTFDWLEEVIFVVHWDRCGSLDHKNDLTLQT
jgi:hypothetical protein